MPRLMSVAMTTQQVRDRSKTVTRRNGWRFVEPGDRLTLCAKVQGRKPGEVLDRIAEVEVVAASREPLNVITPDEVALEGFPGMAPAEFVRRFFVDAQGMAVDDEVTRIQWRYLDGETCLCRSHNPKHCETGPCSHCGTDAEFDCPADCPVGQIVASWSPPLTPGLLDVFMTFTPVAVPVAAPEEDSRG